MRPSPLLLSVSLVIAVTSCAGFQWEGQFINLTTIYACLGDTVDLAWQYSLSANEEVSSISWSLLNTESNHSLEAFLVDGHFVHNSQSEMSYLPNAGIRIAGLQSTDFGVYRVQVTLLKVYTKVNYYLTVPVTLPEAPVTSDLTFFMKKVPTDVKQKTARDVGLGCGTFKGQGKPMASVKMQIPQPGSHRTLEVTRFENGYFVEVLPLPLNIGMYTCQLIIPEVTSRCGNVDRFVLGKAMMEVKDDGDITEIDANKANQTLLLKHRECVLHNQKLMEMMREKNGENERMREILPHARGSDPNNQHSESN